jgi:(E)-4-hydroxy-3-methylbut-2-enyl-diphosphate synthase
VAINSVADLATLRTAPTPAAKFLALEIAASLTVADLTPFAAASPAPLLVVRSFAAADSADLAAFATLTRRHGHTLAVATTAADLAALVPTITALGDTALVFTLNAQLSALNSPAAATGHPLGHYRALAEALRTAGSRAPLWIRNSAATAVRSDASFLSRLLDAAFLTGGLLCDGLGDLVSIETESDPVRATTLAYNVLQGAGARSSKTEFVACPSCGRTLFDLQTTTQRIRAQTGHLKGVKIAIMGCIVNGPGEMADADFGYVGGAPGKINLYVGKTCVQYNLPQAEADARLIALIKEHGKWVEPAPASA